MIWIPDEPEVPDDQRASAPLQLRFEDLSQDGRLLAEALPQALGAAVWERLLSRHPKMAKLLRSGTLPILSRGGGETGDGPISTNGPVEAHARYQLAHTVGPDGEVDRILLNMWARVTGVVGRTYGPPPPNAGQPIEVGRMYAEHVFTRPFAAPGDRKVTALEIDGVRVVPEAKYPARPPETAAALPEGAAPLDPDFVLDPALICFGLDHTDNNQHVNSLVYPRLFFEAALRRLVAHGRSTRLLVRATDIAFRKPSFAGDHARIALRCFELGDRVGAVGLLVSEDEARAPLAAARPRCFMRLLLGP